MKTEPQYVRNQVLPHTQLVTNTENKECQFTVTNTKDTTVHIDNQLITISLYHYLMKTINPVFHLKQLDNYMEVKRISNDRKLILAYKSMNSEMSTQWVETVINYIYDYETFKKEFLNTWWSSSQQSLIKCSIYQDKYDRRSNMSLSAHFLKYAIVTTYLQPKLSEVEIVEAIRFHYPTHIQRMLLTIPSKNISEMLNLLKRIEAMESHESYIKTTNTRNLPSSDNPNIRLNQRRVKPTNQRNNYEQSTAKRHHYPSENEAHPKTNRVTFTCKDNENTPMKFPQSEN
jgi:hypothetical protein